MLGRVYNQLQYEIELKENEEAAIEQLKDSLDRDEAFLGFFAEECGSTSAYAEAESITDALIESKQKQLFQLEVKLLHFETLMKILPGELSELLTSLENQLDNIISEIMEVRTRRVVLETALEQLEKSWSYKGLSGIFRGKTLKKWPWSLLGISASLGLSVLAYSYFRQGVEDHIHTNTWHDLWLII